MKPSAQEVISKGLYAIKLAVKQYPVTFLPLLVASFLDNQLVVDLYRFAVNTTL